MKDIELFKLENGKEPVWVWMNKLEKSVQLRIIDRLTRIAEGNYGDCKKLSNSELSEIRFQFNKGYRIYFAEVKEVIILLLNAGDKSSQSADIKKADKYFKIWKEQNND